MSFHVLILIYLAMRHRLLRESTQSHGQMMHDLYILRHLSTIIYQKLSLNMQRINHIFIPLVMI